MGVVAKKDIAAEVPDVILLQIAGFVAGGRIRDEDAKKEGIVERVRKLVLFSGASKRIHAIMEDDVRKALALVLRVALEPTLSTKTFLTIMHANPELERSVLTQNESVQASEACTESEAAILSRLVELSTAAERAHSAIEVASTFSDDDASEKAVDAREAARDAPKLLGLIERVIESARPALRASLARATVGSGDHKVAMYPKVDGVLDAVIARLKVRPYDSIEPGKLREKVDSFLGEVWLNAEVKLFPERERLGPMCLWDVSRVQSFFLACSSHEASHVAFNSDLFWNTKSAKTMDNMFARNMEFKGYVGTWNVRGVASMDGMFARTAIADSGLANWNTASLTNAQHMFSHTERLSERLDLSGWKFGPEPNLSYMFAQSSIVDCGIGNWDVAGAQTEGMLLGANRFTGSLAGWKQKKVKTARAPAQPAFGSARVAFEGADTQKRIAEVFAAALRAKGARGSSRETQQQCAIL